MTIRNDAPPRRIPALAWALLALGGLCAGSAAQAQLGQSIGFETCPAGATLDAIACAGIQSVTTADGAVVAAGFNGRFGSSGAIGLFSDSGPVTITFAPTVSEMRLNVLAPGAGTTLEAFNAGGTSLGSVAVTASATATAAQIAAAGIARVVVQDPDGEFGLDQLETTPEGAVAGCPVYQDGCAVDVCTVPFHVGGDVLGLDAGESLTLQLNGADDLVVNADGAFQFATILGHDSAYAVTVSVPPSNEGCSVTRSAGVIDDADIDDVLVACGPLRSIGGTVTGLAAGASVTLQNNGGDDLVVSGNGSFTFASGMLDGFTYAATVLTQPSAPMQLCTVSNGSGTTAGDVTTIAVDCVTQTFSVGGTLSGLAPGNTVTLTNNGGDALVLGADGGFVFPAPIPDFGGYAVAVSVQPTSPNQACAVSAGSGTVAGGPVASVVVSCVTNTYSVGGSVGGLAAGNDVVLQINGGETVSVGANGAFAFATSLDDASGYAVAVLTQPSDPDQTCSVANPNGTLAGADVTNVAVNCVTQTHAVGGNVTGLAAGNSVTLSNNGGDALIVSADGAFTFATPIADGDAYLVAVTIQPTSPNQTCSVTNASGSVDGAAVTTVAVACVTETYSIGGTVSGLAAGNSVTLTNNGGDAESVGANGAFTFATALDDGSNYQVVVSAQPSTPSQTCSVAGGTGALAGADVTTVGVTCVTDTRTVGGTVSGLAAGNSVVLTNNGGDALTVSSNGAFQFATPVDDGGAYLVAVSAQPTSPNQTCSVAAGTGTIDGADVTAVSVSCVTETYSVGGTVNGLAPGNSVTLTNNGGDALAVPANGAFTFATALDDGSAYAVAVSVQPTAPDQTCTVSAGSGSLAGADVTGVVVNCSTDTYTVGGTITGLAAGNSVTLTNNAGDALVIAANGAFAFATPLDDGSTYLVAVSVQPTSPNQTCSVINGSGTLAGANVTSVAVSCVTETYSVGGMVNGLAPGNSVTLTNNGGDTLVLSANGAFTFATALDDGSAYAVLVSVQPIAPDQTCTVSAGSGPLAGADVTGVVVNCSTDTYTVGGTVAGLAAGNSVTLTNNAGDAMVIAANGAFAFATPLADGSAYLVAVSVQPTSPNQTCSVTSGGGNLAGANVASVGVSCVTETYSVGGIVNGLAPGNSVTLTNNGGDALVLSANGAFTFATALDDGSNYAVAVSVQPTDPDQTCSVSAGNSALNGADVTGVAVNCSADTYTIGGTLTGLAAGASVALLNNGGDPLSLTANGTFAFPTPVADGTNYLVVVEGEPTVPSQSCRVTNGSGTVDGASVTSVLVTCVTDTFTVGGTLDGLEAGNSITLSNNGGDALVLSADGAFTFATALADGSDYAVVVASQPTSPAQTCVVTNGSGTLSGGNVTAIVVACQAAGFIVTPGAGAGGAIDPDSQQVVDAGETVTFQVTANVGYEIVDVTGCDGTLTGTLYVTGPIEADCAVDATFAKRIITGPTPGGTGTAAAGGDWVFAPAGNGASQSAGFIALAGHPKSPPSAPADLQFPQGLIDFVLVQGAPGSTASVLLTFPQPVPAGALFWVYGASADNPAPHWYVVGATYGGNVMQLLLTDGGLGDGDLAANSAIPLVGGFAIAAGVVEPPPSAAPAVIPAASTWSLFGLAVLVMLLGLGCVRAAGGARD